MTRSDLLLQTKLHVPRSRDDVLPRPRLLDLLKRGLANPLILLSAPAGYGKTTLLAQFAAQTAEAIVWYQLDPTDNDPSIFFEYLLESIARHCPEFGTTTRAVLRQMNNVTAEWQRFLTVFLNDIVENVPANVTVVLDDYHLIDNPLIHSFVAHLLERAPPQLHLLLSTRTDPLIGLARLRARRQLTEIRAHDLRFTPEEARALLAQTDIPQLPEESVRAIVQETEGWAAALHLALNSPAIDTLLTSLSGSNRYLFDYLSEEVLAAQPPEIQTFLLRSSILERLNADLCDAVLNIDHSWKILTALESQNLFIVSLDAHRRWYRYHHLFQDFLQEQLRRQSGDEIALLHLRAASHFEAVGDMDGAIHHYRAASATEKLADLVVRAAPAYLKNGRLQTVSRWLTAIPETLIVRHPQLALYRGMILVTWGRAHGAKSVLLQAQRTFAASGDKSGESRAFNQLCRVAFFEGRYTESLNLNREALRRMEPADHEGQMHAFREQAELWVYLGRSDRAVQAASEAVAHARHLNDYPLLAKQTIFQGVTFRTAGQLVDAERTLRRGLRLLDSSEAFGAHIAYSQMGAVSLERWELENAIDLYRQSLSLSKKFQDATWMVYAHYCLGLLYTEQGAVAQAQPHFDDALALVEQTGIQSLLAEGTYHYIAEAHLKNGQLPRAELDARRAIDARADRQIGLAWGMGWLPLARVYLANGRFDEAETILHDVADASRRGGNAMPYIDSVFLLSWLYLRTGRAEKATGFIRQALATAAPQQHRFTFLSQPDKAMPVLQHGLKHNIEPVFIRELLPMLKRNVSPVTPAVSETDTRLHVTCLGDFTVRHNGQAVGSPGWLAGQAGMLLACFITFRGGGIPRDRILTALWAETSPEKSSAAFHTALYKMRRMLHQSGLNSKFVHARSGEYFLDDTVFHIDAVEFDMRIEATTRHPHDAIENCSACAAQLKQAVILYRGEYLPNLYDDWVLAERRHLAQKYLNALRVLAKHDANLGQFETAIAYGHQMLAVDPLLEDVHRLMMTCYGHLGERNNIKRQYRQLEQSLADELAIEPMPETQTLYQTLMETTAP